MTLRRQLFLGLSLLFLLIFAGMLFLSVQNTRSYLEQQLASHAQDAATSLSLPLAQVLPMNDPVLTQLQLEAVFDRGFYQRVVVLNPAGEVMVSKELPAKVGDVPLWFSKWFALNPPGGEAFVSSGWRQLGKVVVVSQPAHAYQFLWTTAAEVALWLGAAYAVALALMHVLLWVVLNPLYAIERTAKAVQERRFEQIGSRPRARELARVVRAMNDMSRRIAEILDAEAARAEGFRRQVLQDDVTGLDNRRSFDMRFGELLNAEDEVVRGVVLGLEISGLKEFNTGASYEKGNQLLRLVGQLGQSVLGAPRLSARLGGASFAFVLVGVLPEDAPALTQRLKAALEGVFADQDPNRVLSFSLGAAGFNQGNQRGQVMAKLDMAIEAARQYGRNAAHWVADTGSDQDVLGSFGWKDLITRALEEGRWRLYGQPVVRFSDGSTWHAEVMGRLLDATGAVVPAARFIPMAARHQLMPAVDRAIFALAKDYLTHTNSSTALAVNVSAQSLASRSFVESMKTELLAMGPLAAKLSFEVSCFGASQNVELARSFAQMVRQCGCQFGLDRLGLEPLSLTVLRQLPPDYVKLDSAFVTESITSQAAADWVSAIVALARSLDVKVIAQGVETAAQEAAVRLTHDGAQGYHLGAPSALV